MQNLTVAIIQANQFWQDKEANFAHFENLLEQASGSTCDLIILPEMFNTSFSMDAKSLAEDLSGKSIQWLTKQAKKYNTQICATLIIEEENKYFNRLVIVSDRGIEASYNKRHLFRMAGEHQYFEGGSERVIYHLQGWRILLQVCYDLRFPVFSRNCTLEGKPEYDLAIYPANWPERRAYAWTTLLKARAIENQVYVIGVNRVGKDGNDLAYSGDSAVIDPWGNDEYLATKNTEQVKILTLDADKLNQVRAVFPAYLDADAWISPFNQKKIPFNQDQPSN
ncbi:MAG: amidohydrolase [Crocinitomicaceae bacterium]|nr:amidohydrolase [Crocinitomicaceae bacterium]MBK8927203.1 amidohydrolase [Crocinitomicaceae bacterium]